MKFSFKKVGSVLASTAMLTSTIALAAAASFPAPYVTSAGADVAIVHGGAKAAFTDLVAVADITSFLSSELASKTASGTSSSSDSVTGEAAPLFTSGTKLYLNDTLSTVKTTLTKSQLPTILADTTFSGNVEATISHGITIGFNPNTLFAKEPTSSADPDFGLFYSSTQAKYLYNATATFSKTTNLTHANSLGQDLKMFGQTFTISSSTSGTDLVLLKSAERVDLTNEDPSAEVTIGGKKYTVELVSASTTTATVKVTAEDGTSATKEITENASKKVGAVTVAVITSDANNFKLSATIVVGAEKLTLTDGSQVTFGDDNTVIDGTLVDFTGGTYAMDKISLSIYAPTSDADFLKSGESFKDPIFGTFKVDFAGLSIPKASTVDREDISIASSGDDKETLSFTDYDGNVMTSWIWAVNTTAAAHLMHDSDGRNITVFEMGATYDEEYLIVGNKDEAHLLRVSQITNQSSGSSNDRVDFVDALTGTTVSTQTPTAEGTANLVVGGKSYTVYYYGAHTSAQDSRYVTVNTGGTSTAIAYPTIQTKKGARIGFYEPLNISLSNWDARTNPLTTLKIPNGDTFTEIAITVEKYGNGTIGGTHYNNTLAGLSVTAAVGQLTYNFTSQGGDWRTNNTMLYLVKPGNNGNIITTPALVIFEEKDDNSRYEALVVTLDGGASSSNALDVSEVYRTWMTSTSTGSENYRNSLATDSDITQAADLWGTVVSIDSNTAGHKKATISYPDDQLYANVYVAEDTASIVTSSSTGASVSSLGSVAVTDSEADSVSSKSLIVVGGSCVNTVAATLLGVSSPTCGADFTTKTGVASGQYLIETFSRTGGKVATLVAGFNAGDTTNAAKALTTQVIDTTVGKKYTGTTSTDVTAAVTTTA